MGLPDMVVGFDEPIVVCEQIEDWQPQVPQRVSIVIPLPRCRGRTRCEKS